MHYLTPIVFAEASLSAAPLLSVAVYALLGIALAIIGYKLFDLCTPGDIHEEIVKNRNTAAAIIGAESAKQLFEAAYDEHGRRLAKLYQNLGAV